MITQFLEKSYSKTNEFRNSLIALNTAQFAKD